MNKNLTGLVIIFSSFACFALHDASVKWLVERYSPWEIILARSAVLVPFAVAIGGWDCIVRSFRSANLKGIWVRTFVVIASSVLTSFAARGLSLGQLSSIYFLSPIVVAVVSGVVLKERVTGLHWIGLVVGFAGVLVACRPGAGAGVSSVALAVVGMLLWSISLVLMRGMAAREPSSVYVFASAIAQMAIGAVMTTGDWHVPETRDYFAFSCVGLTAAAASYLLFEGLKRARASIVAPMETTTLLWAFFLGALIWGDYPSLSQLMGSALILLSGAIVIYCEHHFSRHIQAELPTDIAPDFEDQRSAFAID